MVGWWDGETLIENDASDPDKMEVLLKRTVSASSSLCIKSIIPARRRIPKRYAWVSERRREQGRLVLPIRRGGADA